MSRGLSLMDEPDGYARDLSFQQRYSRNFLRRQNGGCGIIMWAEVVGCEPVGLF